MPSAPAHAFSTYAACDQNQHTGHTRLENFLNPGIDSPHLVLRISPQGTRNARRVYIGQHVPTRHPTCPIAPCQHACHRKPVDAIPHGFDESRCPHHRPFVSKIQIKKNVTSVFDSRVLCFCRGFFCPHLPFPLQLTILDLGFALLQVAKHLGRVH